MTWSNSLEAVNIFTSPLFKKVERYWDARREKNEILVPNGSTVLLGIEKFPLVAYVFFF